MWVPPARTVFYGQLSKCLSKGPSNTSILIVVSYVSLGYRRHQYNCCFISFYINSLLPCLSPEEKIIYFDRFCQKKS